MTEWPPGYRVLADGTLQWDFLPAVWPDLIKAGGQPTGFLSHIFQYGFGWDLIPLFIFIGIGALTDFTPVIARPIYFLLGAAAGFGVYAAFFMALGLNFTIPEACSIGIIGGPMALPQFSLLRGWHPGSSGGYSYSCLYLHGYGAVDPASCNKGANHQRGKKTIYGPKAEGGL